LGAAVAAQEDAAADDAPRSAGGRTCTERSRRAERMACEAEGLSGHKTEAGLVDFLAHGRLAI